MQAFDEPRQSPRRIVVVIGGGRCDDTVVGQQSSCYAGVFAGDDIGAFKDIERPQGYVAEIANRRGNKVQARRKRGVPWLPRRWRAARLARAFAVRVGRSRTG